MDGPAGDGPLTTRRLLLGVLTVLVAGAGAVAALPRVADDLPKSLATVARLPERLWAQVVPPRVSRGDRQTDLAPAERDAVGTLARRLQGFVVWSSNRSGNHELYRIDLPAGATLRRDDIAILRPGTGLSPAALGRVLGRKTLRAIQTNTPLSEDMLQ